MARLRTSMRKACMLANHSFTKKMGFSIALGVLIVSLAAGSLVALVQQHKTPDSNNDNQLQIIVFKDKEGHDAAKLALMTYDLSIAGFANRIDHWFAFPDHVERIPRSTPLPFGNSYRDLIGGLVNVPSLSLGGEAKAQVTGMLSSYDPATAGNDGAEALKRALATLTVTITEAMRLKPIKETVLKASESRDVHVAREHLPYIEHWDTICHEILRAKKNGGVWDGPFTELLKKLANIHSQEEALAVVSVIGNRNLQQVVMAHARSA